MSFNPEPDRPGFWTVQSESVPNALLSLVSWGYSVIPVSVAPGESKKPHIQWKIYQSEPPTTDDAEAWLSRLGPDIGIALLTGDANGWVVVDADSPSATEWVTANFPRTPLQQRTRRGMHFFYQQGVKAIPTKSGLGPNGDIDVRGRGGLIIIAPSIVDGHARRFEVDSSIEIEDVPTLDELDGLDEFLQVRKEAARENAGFSHDDHYRVDELTGLVIDGRDSYLRNIVFALCQKYASDYGEVPSLNWLSRGAWDKFMLRADTSDDKWQYEDAVEKSQYLLGRINSGEVTISTSDAAPDTAGEILTPDVAAELLNSTLQSFLDYRVAQAEPSEVRHIFIKSPAGLGKTTSTISLTVDYILDRSITTIEQLRAMRFDDDRDFNPAFLFFVRTHNLAREIKGKIESKNVEWGRTIDIPVWRGRTNGAPDNAPCILWRQAKQLTNRGFPVASNLCQRWDWRDDQIKECNHFRECEYISVRRRASPFYLLMSAELPTLGLQNLLWRHSDERHPPGETGFVDPFIHARSYILDESPVDYLVDQSPLPPQVLGTLLDVELCAAIQHGILAPEGLLSSLRTEGYTPAKIRRAAKKQIKHEKGDARVFEPGNPTTDEVGSRIGQRNFYRLSEMLHRLANEVACGRQGESYSLRAVDNQFIAQGRREFRLSKTPGVLLDATGDVRILQQFIPGVELAADIRIDRNSFVTQVSNKTFSRGDLFAGRNTEELRGEVLNFIKEVSRNLGTTGGVRTLVVTYKKLRTLFTNEQQPDLPASCPIPGTTADVIHFGNLRGLDQYKDHGAVVIVGRQEPRPNDLEEQARAIWYDDPKPIVLIPSGEPYPRRPSKFCVRGLGDVPTNERGVAHHPDWRVDALLQQTREAETLQAIDRLRLVHNETRKPVYVLSSVPLPGLTVDRLLAWDELRTGGTRLERALDLCDAQSRNVILLTDTWLCSVFPDLWSTQNAAKRWLEGNPLERNREYTYWGVLIRYRVSRRGGKLRKAFVRNGCDPIPEIASAQGIDPVTVHVGGEAGGAGGALAPEIGPYQ